MFKTLPKTAILLINLSIRFLLILHYFVDVIKPIISNVLLKLGRYLLVFIKKDLFLRNEQCYCANVSNNVMCS